MRDIRGGMKGENDFQRLAFEGPYPALKEVGVRGGRKMLGLCCFSLRYVDIKSQHWMRYLSCVQTQFCSYLRKKDNGALSESVICKDDYFR